MSSKIITDETYYKYVIRMLKTETELNYEHLFQCYIDRGVITLADVVGFSRENLIENIVNKIHWYAISPTGGGRYMTYVKDNTKPNKRRAIKRKNKTELFKFLFVYHSTAFLYDYMTLKEGYFRWVNYKREFINVKNKKKQLSPSTIRSYERDYNKFIKNTPIEYMCIYDITEEILEKELIDIISTKKASESRIKQFIYRIIKLFNYFVKKRYLTMNPAQNLDIDILLSKCDYIPPKSDSDRVLTLNEMSKLRAAVLKHEEKYPSYMPDYAIELAILTGMRVGELAALHWGDCDDDFLHIDFSEHRYDYSDKKSELIIGEPKNRKHRIIPITSDIRELLEKIKLLGLKSKDDFIFVREDGSRYTSHDISGAITRRGKEVGIEKVSVHRVRRTVSSQLNYILPRKDVATLLGHSEKVNEEHYDYPLAEIQAKKQALSQVSVNIINFSDLVMKKKLKESV